MKYYIDTPNDCVPDPRFTGHGVRYCNRFTSESRTAVLDFILGYNAALHAYSHFENGTYMVGQKFWRETDGSVRASSIPLGQALLRHEDIRMEEP